MSDLENHSFALLDRAKERSLIRSSQKSHKKSNRSFALLQRVTKRAIAHSEWASDRTIALLKRAEMSEEQMSDCPTVQIFGSILLQANIAGHPSLQYMAYLVPLPVYCNYTFSFRSRKHIYPLKNEIFCLQIVYFDRIFFMNKKS